MQKANADIRQYAKKKRVFLWQIAEAMGISEPTMTRRLRNDLPEPEKQNLLRIIDDLSKKFNTTL